MRASSDRDSLRSVIGSAARNVRLAWALGFLVWIFAMPPARSRQDEWPALMQKVLALNQTGQKNEAIALAERAVSLARTRLGRRTRR
jgi:hypothetical protein